VPGRRPCSVASIPVPLVIAVAAFVVMEPVTALVHRLVMHGVGRRLHADHHRSEGKSFEVNDLYPLTIAGLTMAAMAAAFNGLVPAAVLPATVGITAYGACYGFVHEIYIHQRIRFPWTVALLEPLRAAHRLHHLDAAPCFGMLVPVVPGRLRLRVHAGAKGLR
jgi:beta-carotene 3-hydroxylase